MKTFLMIASGKFFIPCLHFRLLVFLFPSFFPPFPFFLLPSSADLQLLSCFPTISDVPVTPTYMWAPIISITRRIFQSLHPESGESMCIRNVGNRTQIYTCHHPQTRFTLYGLNVDIPVLMLTYLNINIFVVR